MKESCVCIGLDPDYFKFPEELRFNKPENSSNPLRNISKTILEFNKTVISEIYDIVPAIKIQTSYYERYGLDGVKALIETVKFAKKCGIIVIEDNKVCEIGKSAENYANAHMGKVKISEEIDIPIYDFDIITVNPFFGLGGIKPLIETAKKENKGLFVVIKTSKPDTTDIQDLMIDAGTDVVLLFEVISAIVENENTNNDIGDNGFGIIGAYVDNTFEEYSASIKDILQTSFIIIPDTYDTNKDKSQVFSNIIPLFRNDGYGVLINSSKEVLYAYNNPEFNKDGEPYAKSIRKAVLKMKSTINKELKENFDIKFF